MKPLARVLLELFGPAFFGGLQAMAIGIAGSQRPFGVLDVLQGAVVFFFFALLFCGIQSVCYTVLMELAYRRGVRRRSFQSIGLSVLLGILSGASFKLYSGSSTSTSGAAFFCTTGASVGLIISLIIYFSESRDETKPA